MKLDAKAIRYLTSEDFRVLAGVLIGPSLILPRDARSEYVAIRPYANTRLL